jgi:hypothetical protein
VDGEGAWAGRRAGGDPRLPLGGAPDGIRYLARLPHLNPTQGIRLGEFWEWERAVEAVLAEAPRPLVADPFRDLRYTEPGENADRLERGRQRRRFAGRFS